MTTQPFRGLHPCRRCGVELDADDRNETCEECPRLCWRGECRTGCYYPQVCSERPAVCPLCAKPAHDYRCGVTP
jgi:hypothetical protein